MLSAQERDSFAGLAAEGEIRPREGRLIEGVSTARILTRIVVRSRTARMEENGLLDRAYRALMTPLPESLLPSLDIPGLLASLRAHGERVAGAMALPKDMPQIPEEWKRYAWERGLYPEQRVAAPAAMPTAVPVTQNRGLWEMLHPQGVGSTARGFNDIYPGLGR